MRCALGMMLAGAATWEIEEWRVVKPLESQNEVLRKQIDELKRLVVQPLESHNESLRKQIDELKRTPPPLYKPKEPQIKIVEEPIRSQKQAVRVSIEPALPSGQIVQVWVFQGDDRWYPCLPAVKTPAPNFWSASCEFGSVKLKDVIPGQSRFRIAAFYWKTVIPCPAEGLTDKEWRAFPFKRAIIPDIVFTGGQ